MKRRITCLFICLLLFCSGCGQKTAADVTEISHSLPAGTDILQKEYTESADKLAYHSLDDFELVAENNGAQLYLLYNKNDLIIAFRQYKGGEVMYSSPADYAVGEKVNINAASQLIVEYADASNNIRVVNSVTGAVRSNTSDVKKTENGILVNYRFTKEKESFDIPVTFTVTDEGLKAAVLFDNIAEHGDSTILNISLLPYMNCASYAEAGYFFVPDGCGSIIDFKGKDSDDTSFSSIVFGRDPILSVSMLTNFNQNIYLPVFGVKKQNSSVLSVITEGEALATVKANQIKGDSRYAAIYTVFNYRTRDEVALSNTWNAQRFIQSAVKPNTLPEASVVYNMLEDSNAGYVGMAAKYRELLISNNVGNEISDNISLYLDILGAVKKTKSVLGFPRTVTVPMTAYNQACDIIDDLIGADIRSVNIRYYGGMSGGLDDAAVLKPTNEKVLGGKADWSTLLKKADENGIQLAMDAELVKIFKSRAGWKTYKCATQNVYRMAMQIVSFRLSTQMPKNSDENSKYYLLAPQSLVKEAEQFLKNYNKSTYGDVAYGSLGNTLYSDFAQKRFTNRAKAQESMTDVLEALTKDGKVWLEGGNSYSLPYASAIIGAPMYDSGYALSKCDVPFYQIALHGLVEYTQPASNLDTNPTKLLRMLETGAVPYFIVSGENVFELEGTNQNWIFSGTWTDVSNSVKDTYEKVGEVLNGLNALPITDHIIINDYVRVTVYGDKTAVAVNYSDSEAELCGKTIEPKGYITVPAESVKEEMSLCTEQKAR